MTESSPVLVRLKELESIEWISQNWPGVKWVDEMESLLGGSGAAKK